MRILIVARCKKDHFAPFITEQVAALERVGMDCRFFPIREKGARGYLRHLSDYKKSIREYNPDIIHAHYGLCGLFANLQRRVPVVTTYHGSDINDPKVFWLSRIAMRLSRFNIFVSKTNLEMANPKKSFALIPCGVQLEDYPYVEKDEARRRMGLSRVGRFILFAGAFDNEIKNAPLARDAISLLSGVNLIELKGYSREQVACLMQAVDALIMTSFTEGSPQVIKEALSCGCPIVSVDVGDVKERIRDVDGCFIAERDPKDLAEKISEVISLGKRTDGRRSIEKDGLTNETVAQRIVEVYRNVLSK